MKDIKAVLSWIEQLDNVPAAQKATSVDKETDMTPDGQTKYSRRLKTSTTIKSEKIYQHIYQRMKMYIA